MTRYLAQLHGSLLDPIWEFEFEMPNDKMAIDYMARHVTASFAHCPWFTYIWIRRMSDQKLIAEITLAPPQVKIDDQGSSLMTERGRDFLSDPITLSEIIIALLEMNDYPLDTLTKVYDLLHSEDPGDLK